MKDEQLITISLFIAFAGLVFLFVISNLAEATDTTINKIADGDVRLQGKVMELRRGASFTSILLSQENTVEVVAFSDVDVSVGDDVEVVGEMRDGQLYADKIIR